jgi:nucleotide-binding universal stress UspA family protein
MPSIRDVLVHVDDSPRSAQVLRLAAALAARHGAALRAVYAVESPATGAYLSAEAAALAAQLGRESQQARRELVQARVAEAAPGTPLEMPAGDPLAALLQRARATDLLVLGQHDPHHPEGGGARLASRLLVAAGCPLLFVPFAGGFDLGALHGGPRVLVAWADTRESARALRDALPVLQAASHVELVRFARPGEAVAERLDEVLRHLRRHGVKAECSVRTSREPGLAERVLPRWSPDAPVAEALLSHAADQRIDLVVMGGFGHPRAWELVLGGVTRTLLQSMTVPVLMSH